MRKLGQVGPRGDRFADTLGEVKATTLFDTLEDVDAENLLRKLDDTDTEQGPRHLATYWRMWRQAH